MKLTELEKSMLSKLKNVTIASSIKQGRPRKEIIDYIIFDELESEKYLQKQFIDNKEYYVDNENRLYDIITEEYIGCV